MTSVIRNLVAWFDDRTGAGKLMHEALYERVPGGARWRYVWGSTLVVAFVTQMITGIFLWMAYSPSTQTAWESVFYIQHEMPGGWLLRGIHHFMAQAMVVLLAIHFVQVVWDGAYRAPRELNFVLGLVLMLIVLGLSLTGYLLPWDQKGYWATTVGTNLASQAPLGGAEIRKLAIGGVDYGHFTLTRFFALHAGVLPGLLVAFLVLHVALFRRHGLHAKDPQHAPDVAFWPDQVLKDSVAALAVLAAVLALTIWKGADLAAPADPANPYDAARPEWYFLFLFQFLKWFPGELEIWGAFIIPGVVVAVLFLMPWIGRSRSGHFFNVALLAVLLGGSSLLTVQALHDDYYAQWNEPDDSNAAKIEASRLFLAAQQESHRDAQRVIELAQSPTKIPSTGALTLVYDDPLLQGPKLFRRSCAGCHNHVDRDHPGAPDNIANERPTASNLFGVGSRHWIEGLLDPKQISGPDYLGYEGSPFVGDGDSTDMVDFVHGALSDDLDAEQRTVIEAAFKKIAAALSVEAMRPDDKAPTDEVVAEGRALIEGGLAEIFDVGMSCADCHKFRDEGELGEGPDLTGYMSRQWLIDFVRNPAGERFYGDLNDRMPAFAPHDDPQLNQLDGKSIGLIVDWLRGDWYRAPVAVSD